MKLIIASDIHGSALWCERLLRLVGKEHPDKLLLLGDILYHGPRNDLPEGYAPKKVAELLNAEKDRLIAVQGNCDAEVDRMVLSFPLFAESCWLFDGHTTMIAAHGHHLSPDDRLIQTLPFGSILLAGHTHIPADIQNDNYRYLNPGSVSLPKNGTPHACLRYENGEFAPLVIPID